MLARSLKVLGVGLMAVLCLSFDPAWTNPYDDIPASWPKPLYAFANNPLTPNKVLLGRMLFYDPILSRNGQVSCAACHAPHTAFAHTDHKLSHGIDDQIGTRNAPALQNLAWQPYYMWDGAVHHLDAQALAPLTHPKEMGETLPNALRKLRQSPKYTTAFAQAWGDTLINASRMLKSLSQFMLTLVSTQSKFDKIQSKVPGYAFSPAEAHGYALFQQHCAHCHPAPLFTTYQFENNGLQPDSLLQDRGRQAISQRKADAYRFKVPSLRNVEVTAPYMHDGRYPNLAMVLYHYTHNLHASVTLSKALRKPIRLSETDKADVIAFLTTLTDDTFLRNPNFQYPRQALLGRP